MERPNHHQEIEDAEADQEEQGFSRDKDDPLEDIFCLKNPFRKVTKFRPKKTIAPGKER